MEGNSFSVSFLKLTTRESQSNSNTDLSMSRVRSNPNPNPDTDLSMSRFLSINNKIWNVKLRKVIAKVKYFFTTNCAQ